MKSRLVRVALFALCALVLVAGCEKRGSAGYTPEDSEPDFVRGRSLIRQGNDREALAAFLKVISERGDEAPESHLEAGLIYQQHIKDQIAAIYHFRKYLELEPNSRQAELVRQRIEAAKREFARTLPAHPEEDASIRLGYMDQLDRLQRENDRLKAEIAALRSALPSGTVVASSGGSSGGFDIPVAPVQADPQSATQTSAQTPAQQLAEDDQAPIVRAPLSGTSGADRRAAPGLQASGATQARTATAAPAPSAARKHTVQQGDTLYSLAQRYYGARNRWREIYQANRDILKSERDTLRIGMELKIP